MFAQDHVQYNIVVIENRGEWDLQYEKILLNAKLRPVEKITTVDQDSFMMLLLSDLHSQVAEKNQILFYVHGMWGGTRVGFTKAYGLMTKNYLNAEDSDIARIVSLKWPGNDMEYKTNKERLYRLAPFLGEELFIFIRRFQLLQIATNGKVVFELDMLAHSLGNELVKECFKGIDEAEWIYPLFDQMIFAAPDFDEDIYSDQEVMSALHHAGRRSHIYFSERDLTLEVSKNLNKKDRIGRCGPGECNLDNEQIYFVDVTLVKDDTNFPDLITGHSYFRSSPIVSNDMLQVMMGLDANYNPARKIKDETLNLYILNPVSELE